MTSPNSRRAAFSLLEITIAIFILAVGVTGVLALFPQAMDAGSESVQNNYVTSIAQSVIAAVESGLRRDRYEVGSTGWQYFIFSHDGVQDERPSNPADLSNYTKVYDKDFCILLPSGSTQGVVTNDISLAYPAPEPNKRKTMTTKPTTTAWTAADDDQSATEIAADGSSVYRVLKVYHLGYKKGSLLPAFSSNPNATSTDPDATVADPYAQYSFAFFLRRAKIDSDGDLDIDANDEYSNRLFEIQVQIFKSFNDDLVKSNPIPKVNVPVAEFQSIVGY